MNKKKQVMRVFLFSLFITIICLSTEVFAAETIGSISNPASLKVGGETHKYYLNSLTMEFGFIEYAYKQLSIFTRPAASTIQKVSNSRKGTISLTYSKSARASGYLVQVYSSNNKLVKKVITRGNYAKFTGLASGKKYLVKVIPYRLINGKPLYCSNPKYKYVITK